MQVQKNNHYHHELYTNTKIHLVRLKTKFILAFQKLSLNNMTIPCVVAIIIYTPLRLLIYSDNYNNIYSIYNNILI